MDANLVDMAKGTHAGSCPRASVHIASNIYISPSSMHIPELGAHTLTMWVYTIQHLIFI